MTASKPWRGSAIRSPEVRRGALIALDQMDHGKLSQADVTRALETDNARVQRDGLGSDLAAFGLGQSNHEAVDAMVGRAPPLGRSPAALRGVLLAFVKDKSIQKLIAQSLVGQKTPQWTKLLLLDVIGHSELQNCRSPGSTAVGGARVPSDADITRAAVTAIAAVNQSLDATKCASGRPNCSRWPGTKSNPPTCVWPRPRRLASGTDDSQRCVRLLAQQCRAKSSRSLV